MIYNIKQVHIEGSGRCNSRCPMCSRHTADGYVQPDLDELDLHPDVFYKLFTPELCSNLNHVYFSGVYGDPCMNKALPDFVEHFKTHDVDVAIDSNAGYRNTRWWARLGSMGTRVHFAIDGLEDTNHLYRRNVLWSKVEANVKAFQEAGGNGAWTFIVFKHNEHQVEQAKEIATSLGMDFRIKITQKFRGYKNWAVMEDGERLYDLEPPENPKYRHANVGDKNHLPVGSYFQYKYKREWPDLDNNTIVCSAIEKNEVFLCHTGHLLPCCFLGTTAHDSAGPAQFKDLFDLDTVDLNKVSVKQALDAMVEIEKTFTAKSIAEGKLITCARTCGKNTRNKTEYV
jgi:MoaA/NifB/PqqE/SkfB family radical SAM enzyme